MDYSKNQTLKSYKDAIEAKLMTIAQTSKPASLYEPVRYGIEGGGKRLRPVILLAACEAVGGDPEEALDAAVSVELLHTFTLVHDDIMDTDTWRRGRETVHKKWDSSTAILAGDATFALAYQSLLRTKIGDIRGIINLFNEGVLGVCEGQSLDIELELKDDVSNSEYIEMIDKKTGFMLSMSAGIGALIGGASSDDVTNFKQFGMDIGRAFQLQDDYLEITSTKAIMGKSLGSDLSKGKKTFLLINAFNLADENQKEELHEILSKEEITKLDLNRVRELFEDCGVLELTKKQISKYIMNAKTNLEFLPLESRENLLLVTDMVNSREN